MSTKKDELYRTACRRITKLESKIETTRADADRLAEALKRIAGQFECHACSDCTDIARAALAAHERGTK